MGGLGGVAWKIACWVIKVRVFFLVGMACFCVLTKYRNVGRGSVYIFRKTSDDPSVERRPNW